MRNGCACLRTLILFICAKIASLFCMAAALGVCFSPMQRIIRQGKSIAKGNSVAEDNTLGSICAVVVTYNIGNGFNTCFNSLRGQVDHAVIVNTSSDDGATARVLQQTREAHPDFIDVLECPENNLGMAQNMGIARALELDYDWVMLLDHDSRLEAGMVSAMEQAYQQAENRLNIGLIAPNLIDSATGEQRYYLRPWFAYWFERKYFDAATPVIDHVLTVAASGSLIPARVLQQDDMQMDEDFIIDCVDTDFCLRLVTEGMRILAVRDAKLHYKIRAAKPRRLFGLTVQVATSLPERRYYLYRNRFKLWVRYAAERPSFLIHDVIRTVAGLWRIILFEEEKNTKFKAVTQGFWDALRGLRGPRPGSDITRAGVLKPQKDAA